MRQKKFAQVLAIGLIVLGMVMAITLMWYFGYQHTHADEMPLQLKATATTCSYEVPHQLETAVTANRVRVGEKTILKTSTAGLGEPYYIVVVKSPEMSLETTLSTTSPTASDPESDVPFYMYIASDILQFTRIQGDWGIEFVAAKPGSVTVLLGVMGEAAGMCDGVPWYSWVTVYSDPIPITVER